MVHVGRVIAGALLMFACQGAFGGAVYFTDNNSNPGTPMAYGYDLQTGVVSQLLLRTPQSGFLDTSARSIDLDPLTGRLYSEIYPGGLGPAAMLTFNADGSQSEVIAVPQDPGSAVGQDIDLFNRLFFFSFGTGIGFASLDSSASGVIELPSALAAGGVSVDGTTRQAYVFSNGSEGNSVYRVGYDGAGLTQLFDGRATAPSSTSFEIVAMDFDPEAMELYWAYREGNSSGGGANGIKATSVVSVETRDVFKFDWSFGQSTLGVRDIAIDSIQSEIWWSAIDNEGGHIFRSNRDGSAVTRLTTLVGVDPSGLTIGPSASEYNFPVTPPGKVPEPSSFALVCVAFAGLLTARRRAKTGWLRV